MEKTERLLTPGEVALMFRVDPKTVTRWASAGRIGGITCLGDIPAPLPGDVLSPFSGSLLRHLR